MPHHQTSNTRKKLNLNTLLKDPIFVGGSLHSNFTAKTSFVRKYMAEDSMNRALISIHKRNYHIRSSKMNYHLRMLTANGLLCLFTLSFGRIEISRHRYSKVNRLLFLLFCKQWVKTIANPSRSVLCEALFWFCKRAENAVGEINYI